MELALKIAAIVAVLYVAGYFASVRTFARWLVIEDNYMREQAVSQAIVLAAVWFVVLPFELLHRWILKATPTGEHERAQEIAEAEKRLADLEKRIEEAQSPSKAPDPFDVTSIPASPYSSRRTDLRLSSDGYGHLTFAGQPAGPCGYPGCPCQTGGY